MAVKLLSGMILNGLKWMLRLLLYTHMDSFFQRQATNGLQLTTHPEISHTHTQKKTKKVMKYLMNALPKTNIAPENGWLEY